MRDSSHGGGPDGAINSIAPHPDGRIVIGGWFKNVSGISCAHVARLNADGSLDRTFEREAGLNAAVFASVMQSGGKVVIVGGFTNVADKTCQRIARLNPDGTVDASFNLNSGMDQWVHAVALQADGKILVGGGFEHVAGVPRRHIARLEADGTLDPSFDPGAGADSYVRQIVVDKHGDVIVAGPFTRFNQVARSGIARLHGNRPAEKLGAGEKATEQTTANEAAKAKPLAAARATLQNETRTVKPETKRKAESGSVSLDYGLYIHFGIETFTGGADAEHLGKVPASRYAPTGLDVRGWARTARQAGMSFAVLTAKHEAGFCLWDSQDYSHDVASSPVTRDVVAEFVAACQAEGIRPGIHYSVPDAHNEGKTGRGPVNAPYFDLIKHHITELHTKYLSLRLQLFDPAARFSAAQFQELCRSIKRLNPPCAILMYNPNVGNRFDPQNEFNKVYVVWGTVNKENSGFWSPNALLNPPSALYEHYAQTMAQGRAFLLNVGPDRAGRIPDEYSAVLMRLKDLIERNRPKLQVPPAQ